MKRPYLIGTLCTVVFGFISQPSYATLITIGTATYDGIDYSLIYDVEDQLTWLDYTYSGSPDLYTATLNWAADLNSGALTINLDSGYSASWGSTEWRLPTAEITSWGGSSGTIGGSELEELYYSELGNELNDTSLNYGIFSNLGPNFYWMEPDIDIGVTYAPYFRFSNGKDGFTTVSTNGLRGVAVRSGAVSAIPIPAAVWLFGSGLGLLGWIRRRQTA